MQDRWIISPCENLNGGGIAWNEICESDCIARLLFRKGFQSTDEVQKFLRPRLSSLSDPFLLPQMGAAVRRIFAALDSHERIVLFGDYDVDGVTSLALLAEMLRGYGATPELFLLFGLDAFASELLVTTVDLAFRIAHQLLHRANRIDQPLARAFGQVKPPRLLRDLEPRARDAPS